MSPTGRGARSVQRMVLGLSLVTLLPRAARAEVGAADAGRAEGGEGGPADSGSAPAPAASAASGGSDAGPRSAPAPRASEGAGADAGASATDGGPSVLTPPVAVALPSIDFPPDAPPIAASTAVTVVLTIDATGAVTAAEVRASAGPLLDQAVIAGVKRFRFQPARRNGVAVPVRVPFTQTFEPPEAPPPPLAGTAAGGQAAVALDAVLVGLVLTRGTRQPVVQASVSALDTATGNRWAATTDATGVFELSVLSGRPLEIRVSSPDHDKFIQTERLEKNQRLRVKYLLEGRSYGQYVSYVRAQADRTEVSRTTLSGPEIHRVPGTFGDPFRVINLLPGVTSAMGLLPLPIVRGSSPGATGTLLDGVRLPLLFHLLAGPSVVHPEFIDHVDFYPGGFPVTYGGYTGGIIDGVTRPARSDEHRVDIDLNLTETGGMVRQPVPALGMTATLAGRIGYPGILLSLLAPNVSLSYWDYQARFDGGSGAHHWTIFAYGASDDLKSRSSSDQPLQTLASFGFHRIDLRYQHGDATNWEQYRVILGYDATEIGGGGNTGGPIAGDSGLGNGTWSVNPIVRVHRSATPTLDYTVGLESYDHTVDNQSTGTVASQTGMNIAKLFNSSGFYSESGAFVEVVWKPTDRLRLIPGVRGDVYDERQTGGDVTQWSLDPRLLGRYRLTDPEHGAIWLKGVVGRYHQPPRLFLPIPGLDASSLSLGLLASTQYSAGVEARLAPATDLDVNVYYNSMDPILFDLTVNPTATAVQQAQPSQPAWFLPTASPTQQRQTLNDLFVRRVGRSYGLEVLIRRRAADHVFGWLSYTLSRSERQSSTGWTLFDFDRLHVVNLVTGLELPRNWEIGTRVLFQTGTPLTTIFGTNDVRGDSEFRLDLRLDKRAVWNRWLLDFYVDIINTTVATESGGLLGASSIRYVVPTIGFRAVL